MANCGSYRRRQAIVSISPALTTTATSLNDIINNPVELEFFKVCWGSLGELGKEI